MPCKLLLNEFVPVRVCANIVILAADFRKPAIEGIAYQTGAPVYANFQRGRVAFIRIREDVGFRSHFWDYRWRWHPIWFSNP